ncbi:hypothetical protein GBAR_LOCUS11852, partial [Geodia barretti]
TDTHSLDGLQRGVTYYISIVALSPHLPSPLAGPITVIANPLLVYVETSPESLTTSPNTQFSVNCTARAEVDGQSIPVDIEWTRIDVFSPSGPSQLVPTLYTTTGSPERGYQSVLTTSENDTGSSFFYRCIATVSSYSSFSDTIVFVKIPIATFTSTTEATTVYTTNVILKTSTTTTALYAEAITTTAPYSSMTTATVTPTTKVVEGESGPDKTALTAGVLAGGICVIIVSPLVFVLVFLDCKRFSRKGRNVMATQHTVGIRVLYYNQFRLLTVIET